MAFSNFTFMRGESLQIYKSINYLYSFLQKNNASPEYFCFTSKNEII